ncbi:hypothetical protein [Scale drop disease virus]|uniref:ORF_107L n=1 Tax=Scale drop disease virus TaxID=1697349 RepID=A0A0K1L6C0_9VIRU|nr:ORF_107L [Scale drop disease virus]AKU37522.1 ORF_107L [Scale drop disease virus]QLI60779.1 hypothetical protein [Scale drop disease virus]QXJ13697.1 ORF107L [Scale drop disease virus]UNH60676.1 hypothetical protein SDDV_ORF007 [Scale drop disease virus]
MDHLLDTINNVTIKQFRQLLDTQLIEVDDHISQLCAVIECIALNKPKIWQATIVPFGIGFNLKNNVVHRECIHLLISLNRSNLKQQLEAAVSLEFIDVKTHVASYRCNNGDSLLHVAAQQLDWSMLYFLVTNLQLDVTTVNHKHITAIELMQICNPDMLYAYFVDALNVDVMFYFQCVCSFETDAHAKYMINRRQDCFSAQAVVNAARQNHVNIVCAMFKTHYKGDCFDHLMCNAIYYMIKYYCEQYCELLSETEDNCVVNRQQGWFAIHTAAYYQTKQNFVLLACNSSRAIDLKDAYGHNLLMVAICGLVDYHIDCHSDSHWDKLDYIQKVLHIPMTKRELLSKMPKGRKEISANSIDMLLAAVLRYSHRITVPEQRPTSLTIRNGLLFAYRLYPQYAIEHAQYSKTLFVVNENQLNRIKSKLYQVVLQIVKNHAINICDNRHVYFAKGSSLYNLLDPMQVPSLQRLCNDMCVKQGLYVSVSLTCN